MDVVINFPSGLLDGLKAQPESEEIEPAVPELIAAELRSILGESARVRLGTRQAVVITYEFTGDSSQDETIGGKIVGCLMDNGYAVWAASRP